MCTVILFLFLFVYTFACPIYCRACKGAHSWYCVQYEDCACWLYCENRIWILFLFFACCSNVQMLIFPPFFFFSFLNTPSWFDHEDPFFLFCTLCTPFFNPHLWCHSVCTYVCLFFCSSLTFITSKTFQFEKKKILCAHGNQ